MEHIERKNLCLLCLIADRVAIKILYERRWYAHARLSLHGYYLQDPSRPNPYPLYFRIHPIFTITKESGYPKNLVNPKEEAELLALDSFWEKWKGLFNKTIPQKKYKEFYKDVQELRDLYENIYKEQTEDIGHCEFDNAEILGLLREGKVKKIYNFDEIEISTKILEF